MARQKIRGDLSVRPANKLRRPISTRRRLGSKPVEREKTPRENAFDYFIGRRFPHKICFTTPGGTQGFNGVITWPSDKHLSSDYYPPAVDPAIIKHNLMAIKDARLLMLGGARGIKEALQANLYGRPRDVINVDAAVDDYRESCTYNMVQEGVPKEKIRFIADDFMYFGKDGLKSKKLWTTDDSFWADKNWDRIRPADDATPLVVTMYGHTFGNYTLPEIKKFLLNLRAKLHPGDIAYISIDSTQDEGLLKKAYSIPPFLTWFSRVFEHVCRRYLNLHGVKSGRLGYEVEVTKERHGVRVVRGYVTVDKDHPDLTHPELEKKPSSGSMDLNQQLDEIEREFTRIEKAIPEWQKFIEAMNNFKESRFEMMQSRRFPEKLLLTLFKECGFEVRRRPGSRDSVPLRAPANDNWAKQGVNSNIWGLVAA